jgi:acyl-CoA reductase-like NAD-dependent aldehyde dehydrogenase
MNNSKQSIPTESSTFHSRHSFSTTEEMETALQELNSYKDSWASKPIHERLKILDRLKKDFLSISDEWVNLCLQAKGLNEKLPAASEELASGSFPVIRYIFLLHGSLVDIEKEGLPRIPGPIKTRKDGQLVVQIFPQTLYDKIFFGITIQVWMQPGENLETLKSNQAQAYRTSSPEAKIALILGSGNFSAQVPMDVLYKVFVENRSVLYKTNPVNAYLRPLLEKSLKALIDVGALRVVDGGASEGAYLSGHSLIDEIHITGSRSTLDAITAKLSHQKSKNEKATKELDKRITAELGSVGPFIVVPGPWTDKDVAYHAEHLVSCIVPNAGCNCSTPRVLIQDRNWSQRNQFLDDVRLLLSKVPLRKAYYPGSEERYKQFLAEHSNAEKIGDPEQGKLPWTLITDVSPENKGDICFAKEPFCSILSETSFSSDSVPDYLDHAVELANKRLCGSLVATIVVHPKSLEDKKVVEALDHAIADLNQGTIGINYWGGTAYVSGISPWGAFQGVKGEGSESGSGVINNALMLANTQKTVVRAPFRMRPKPIWFVSRAHRAGEVFQKLTQFDANPSFWKVPSILWSALKP